MRLVVLVALLVAVTAVPTRHLTTTHAPAVESIGFDKCDICKTLVSVVDNALVQNKTEEEVKSAITGFCHMVEAGPLKDVGPYCELVAANTDRIIKLVAMEATPDRVCDELFSTCAANPTTLLGADSPVDLNADNCLECKLLVAGVESMIARNSTEEELETAMHKLCGMMANSSFSALEPMCNNLADNIPQIVSLLEQKYPAETVCALFGQCSTEALPPVALDKCAVCEEVVHLAEGALQQNKTEHEIESLVNDLCAALAKTPLSGLAPACTTIANDIPTLLHLLSQDVPAEKICQLLNMCDSVFVAEVQSQAIGLDKCEMCEEVVSLAENALAQNKTEGEIADKLNELCDALDSSPLKGLAGPCREVASQVPVLIHLIESQLPAKEICTLLKVCSSHVTLVTSGLDKCDICEEVVTLAEEALKKNSTEAEVHDMLEKVCSVMADSPLSSLAPYCTEIADKTALLIQLIEDELPPAKICQLLKVCSSDNKIEQQMKEIVDMTALGLDKCDVCKEVVGLAETGLRQNKTEEEIESLVNSLCNMLDNSPLKEFGPICHELATKIPAIVELLESQAPPERVCEMLKVCSASATMEEKTLQHMMVDVKVDKCSICEEVVELAEKAVQRNATEQELEDDLNQLCTLIENSPLKQFAPMCHEIAGNVPLLVQLLESQLPPQRVCELLKFCTSTHVTTKAVRSFPSLGDDCETCTTIVTLAENALKENGTETEIAELLNSVCTAMESSPFSSFAPQCKEIASNVPLLVQLLESELPPQKVCQLLKQCTSTVSVTHTRMGVVSVDKCEVCDLVVGFAEQALERNSTEEELGHLMDHVCSIIGSSPLSAYEPVCKQAVANIPLLVQLLESDLPPSKVCLLLRLCSSDASLGLVVTEFGVDTCDVCKQVVEIAAFEVEQNKTETEIVTLAHDLCTELEKTPLSPLAAACGVLADQIPSIIPQLVNKVDPATLCADLGQCNSTMTAVPRQ